MRPRWTLAAPAEERFELARATGASPLAAQCLINRGVRGAEAAARFLEPRLKELEDPFDLPDAAAAVERLWRARIEGELCVIFGDYDVDGVTSTAILEEGLGALGWRLAHYLPRRLDDGYGLSVSGLEACCERHPATVLIAVDCGSTTPGAVAWLQSRGVDVLVLDHHQISDPPPRPAAMVNPWQRGPEAAGRELCSAGLAFKLLHAVVKRGRAEELAGFREFDLKRSLDLVALGSVADMAPMIGENRALVSAGLRRLETTRRPGLIALKEVSRTRSPVGVYEAGFQLAPRLNAAGRLETAEASLELLLSPTLEAAREMAQWLDEANRERQDIERAIAEQAVAQARARFDPLRDMVVVEGSEGWHLGVVGIVAARVAKEFHRPTIILGGDREFWRGSGRSLPGFDLAAALRECGDLLHRHGGHAMAAGVTLDPSRVDEFRERLNEAARRAWGGPPPPPLLSLDAAVTLGELTVRQVAELGRLGPFGVRNPAVQLAVEGVRLARPPRRLGREQKHLALALTDGSTVAEALWWNAGDPPAMGAVFSAALAPEMEGSDDAVRIRFRLLDWRPAADRFAGRDAQGLASGAA